MNGPLLWLAVLGVAVLFWNSLFFRLPESGAQVTPCLTEGTRSLHGVGASSFGHLLNVGLSRLFPRFSVLCPLPGDFTVTIQRSLSLSVSWLVFFTDFALDHVFVYHLSASCSVSSAPGSSTWQSPSLTRCWVNVYNPVIWSARNRLFCRFFKDNP